ncbi:MAG: tetratricopeptide repeat-containing sensor histidine kinase [Bacteroidales bacterium]|nr:tetratricopeptide repeat-containing sensor histidine kinase [Bacteroidales bacterium]
MRKGKIFLIIGILLILSYPVSYGQITYFPHCYKYPSSENLNNSLIEELYRKAVGYVTNADIDSLEYSAIQMKSLHGHHYTLYEGLIETQDGVINYFKGNSSEALEHFLKALNIYSEENFLTGINTLLNNIAIIFAVVGDYQSSKKYLLRAIEVNEREGLDYYALFSYNLAEVELEMGNYEAAIDILKELIRNENYLNVTAVSIMGSIISAYNKLGNKKEAESWINRGFLTLDDTEVSEVDKLNFYTSVMEYHLNNKDYEKVISISLQYNIDERYNLPDQLDHLEYLCIAYAATGNYAKAWKYEKILNEAQPEDDILNREEIIDLLMVEYEETRNIRIKESINREINLNMVRQNAAHKLMITSIIALLAFIILFLILLRIRKIRNRYRDEFSVETEKFALVNRELQKTNKELEKENKLLDTLISVFAHDLINPFQAILGFSKLMVDDYEALDKESMKEYSSMLSETSFQMSQLLINLQSIATIQEGKDKLQTSRLKVKTIVDQVVSLYRPIAEKKEISIVSSIDSEISALINPDVLRSAIRNILNNAIKYSKPGGEIRIKAGGDKDFVTIAVEDDGVGMDDEVRESVLKGNYLMSNPGTGSEKGSGLGLTICIDLLQMNQGELDIDNSRKKGTTIIIKIPGANA